MTPIGRFWGLLSPYRKEIRQIYVYAFLIGIVNLTLPLGIQAIINFLQTGELTSTWIILVCFVLAGIAITGFLQVIQIRIVENIQQEIFARSALEFAFRLPKIAALQFDKIHAPELVNRFWDTLTLQKGLPKILIDFSVAVFQIVFGLILLAIYSPYFIILGFALALILWIIFKITGPKGLETSLKESKHKYSLAHWLDEIARMNRSFKIFSKHKFHLNKTDDAVEKYLVSREKHFQVLITQFMLFIGFKIILAAGLLILGGYLVMEERMDIGQFVASEIIIILIINSVEKVLNTIDIIYDVLTALDKIGYVTDLHLDKDIGKAVAFREDGLAVRAKEIVFGFPEGETKILNRLSFDIKANEKLVLTGESGSGKSLLLQILAGIHEIEDGGLYINEIPYANFERDQLSDQLGVSFPINQIFEGSYLDNILLGRVVPDEKLSAVVKLLKLDEYLVRQPKGIHGFVDSGGRRLPRSIIQKLLIARVIVGEPQLLLMEDPLQFIDEEEKKRIVDYFMDSERQWTVVIVSDFYYWKEKCDRFIVLQKN